MIFVVILGLIGLGIIIYGWLEQKNKYSKQYFAEGTIVAHKEPLVGNELAGAKELLFKDSNAISYILFVSFTTETGENVRIAMKTTAAGSVAKWQLDQYPELQVGGKVMVTYFGDHPKQCYIMNHPLSHKLIKLSPFLFIGIGVLLADVGLMFLFRSI